MITVLRAGVLTTVQDLGRAGWAHLGVPRSGAADQGAHVEANRLVGNPASAATLETTALGCRFRVHVRTVIAVTGARCDVFVGGVRAPWAAPVRLAAGQTVEVGPAVEGLRSSVAFRGGVDVPPVLGSRSTDLLSGLGPAPLRDGDVLGLGPEPDGQVAWGAVRAPRMVAREGEAELTVDPGPRASWLEAAHWEQLASLTWTVGTDSNRVGLRLEGEPLTRAREGELPSEGMVLGAVQLPPSGLPVVFLADHPTTGGYPVIGVVDAAGVATAAQARPGDRVRLIPRG